MKTIYIVGGGGVGSWATPAMCRLVGSENVCVVDGDILEKKNLDRQLYNVLDIGSNKATRLGEKYSCGWIDKWYSHGLRELDKDDWLLCCVDNNAGRAAVLESCDVYGCKAIFGANEVTSAEAYYYEPRWKDKDGLDPRKYYPEILTDKRFDPLAVGSGCTGAAAEENVQLVSANYMAAGLMQHLYVIQAIEGRKIKGAARGHLPHRIIQNLTSYEVKKPITIEPKGK